MSEPVVREFSRVGMSGKKLKPLVDAAELEASRILGGPVVRTHRLKDQTASVSVFMWTLKDDNDA